MEFADQLGRLVNIPLCPERIISVVPSQTELLYDLGLANSIAGVTRFCVHPENARSEKAIVGGTKNLKPDVIRKLNPDLIIANKEENDREQIEALMPEFPVWISDVKDLGSACEMIKSIGQITGTGEKAVDIKHSIEDRFSALKAVTNVRALYLIWRKPWMSVGNDTFIHHIMRRCGLENVCAGQGRYPVLSDEEIKMLNPEAVLLSSEPYPFKEKHIAEIATLLPESKIILVDGEMFAWYGSRLLHSPGYLSEMINKLTHL